MTVGEAVYTEFMKLESHFIEKGRHLSTYEEIIMLRDTLNKYGLSLQVHVGKGKGLNYAVRNSEGAELTFANDLAMCLDMIKTFGQAEFKKEAHKTDVISDDMKDIFFSMTFDEKTLLMRLLQDSVTNCRATVVLKAFRCLDKATKRIIIDQIMHDEEV